MKKRKKKYKSVITKRIFKAIEKVGVCILIVVFFVPIMAMRGTNAGFSDEEKSEGNKLEIETLDALANYTEYFDADEIIPGNQADGKMTIENVGSLDFEYRIKYKNIGGDADLCNALLLTAKKDGVAVYDKKLLKDFDLKKNGGVDFFINALNHNDWDFKIELPDGAGKNLEEKDCEFSFEINSWQTDFPDGTQGFADQEITEMQKIEIGEWINPGDVIINEIMWMGSEGDGNDEWIELKNMTDETVDLTNWDIVHGGSGTGGHIEIPSGYSIKAHEFFLITKKQWDETKIKFSGDLDKDEGYAHVSSMSLNNDGEDLILQDKSANTIDTAWKSSGDWPAGYENNSSNYKHQSMERNDIPDDGALSGSWHTCDPGAMSDSEIATMRNYWDSDAQQYNCGTPWHSNLSVNDPSDEKYNPDFKNEIEKIIEPVIETVENVAVGSDILPADPVLELTPTVKLEPALAEPLLEKNIDSDKIPVEDEEAKAKLETEEKAKKEAEKKKAEEIKTEAEAEKKKNEEDVKKEENNNSTEITNEQQN